MQRRIPQENTGRVVAVAFAFFGGLAALGLVNGVFDKLAREELAALALFALGFALASYALDGSLRAWVGALFARPAALRKSRAKSPGASRVAT